MVFDKMSAIGSKIMEVAEGLQKWAFEGDPPLGNQISNYMGMMLDESGSRSRVILDIEGRTGLEIGDGALNWDGDLGGSRFIQTTAHAMFTVGVLALPLAWPVGLGLFGVGLLTLGIGVGVGKLEAHSEGKKSPTTLELLGLGTPMYVRCLLFGVPSILVGLLKSEKKAGGAGTVQRPSGSSGARGAQNPPGPLPPQPWNPGFEHVPYLAQHSYLREGAQSASDEIEIDGKFFLIEQKIYEPDPKRKGLGKGELIRLVELDQNKEPTSRITKWYLRSEDQPNRFWEESKNDTWIEVKAKGKRAID